MDGEDKTATDNESSKKKNTPRHVSAMDAAYERELGRLEKAILNFVPVWRGRQAVLRSTALGDTDAIAAVGAVATTVLAEATSQDDQA